MAPETVPDKVEMFDIESIYDAFPDTAPRHDLSTGPAAELQAALLLAKPMYSHPMRARLGLSVRFFVPGRDADFEQWDVLYPVVTQASIKERLHCQCTSPALQGALLRKLLTGHGALHEYPGGCPPPAAFAPIQLPMRDDASPIFTAQHTLSQAACEGRDCVIEERMRYGIDEPSTVFAQMPVFTIPKPGTDERRVLFDDSANNSLNIHAVGMQLPTPLERALFLRDTKLLMSRITGLLIVAVSAKCVLVGWY
ncbi:hypothetical protein IW137_001027 [Coemansia sp. RSA 1287]|nr:hypothetical protein IW137_001027 [Coemansia sp. RSA 1287]